MNQCLGRLAQQVGIGQSAVLAAVGPQPAQQWLEQAGLGLAGLGGSLEVWHAAMQNQLEPRLQPMKGEQLADQHMHPLRGRRIGVVSEVGRGQVGHLLGMLLVQRCDEGTLARKILVERAHADSRDLGDAIGGRSLVA